jgi:hypothetical protein
MRGLRLKEGRFANDDYDDNLCTICTISLLRTLHNMVIAKLNNDNVDIRAYVYKVKLFP